MGQGRVYLRQFQAPQRRRMTLAASRGFVEEPLGFAVVIWTIHSGFFGGSASRPRQGYYGLRWMNVIRQTAVQPVPRMRPWSAAAHCPAPRPV
jgi:hypothetical protein